MEFAKFQFKLDNLEVLAARHQPIGEAGRGFTSKKKIYREKKLCTAENKKKMKKKPTGPKIYRKSVMHLLKYRFAVHLSRCRINLR